MRAQASPQRSAKLEQKVIATIQIRDVPEETYEVIRKRARARGQSIQGYMHDRVVEDAASPTADDIWDTVGRLREQNTGTGATTEQIVADVRAIRGD